MPSSIIESLIGSFTLSDPGLASTLRTLWEVLRDAHQLYFRAYLSEAWVFHILHEAGVKAVRGIEGSRVDGALACPAPQAQHVYGSADSDGRAAAAMRDLQHWRIPLTAYASLDEWCTRNPHVCFVMFDVKFVSLSNRRSGGLDYNFGGRASRALKAKNQQPAEFYIIVIEGVEEYVAILPRETWVSSAGHCVGTDALVSRIPPWYQPFMVAVSDLKTACDRIAYSASSGTAFENPTTRVRCRGWVVEPTRQPELHTNSSEVSQNVLARYVVLWRQLERIGASVHLNPVAPLFFDFTVVFPGTAPLRFEHKAVPSGAPWQAEWSQSTGARSPFTSRRIWHVLWIESTLGITCITRDQVQPNWRWSAFTESRTMRHTFPEIEGAVAHILMHAEAARQAADDCVRAARPDDSEPGLPRSSLSQAADASLEGRALADEHSAPAGKPKSFQSDSLCQGLNSACRENGYGVVFPLDLQHPLGTHVMVDHHWTAAERDAFDGQADQLPFAAYSRSLCQVNARCIVLRLQDFSAPARPASLDRHHRTFGALSVAPGDWLKPIEPERNALPYPLLVGRVTGAHLRRVGEMEGRPSWFLLLPSEFTRVYDSEQRRRPLSLDVRTKGGHVFLPATIESRVLSTTADPLRRALDGRLVADDINAVRYIVKHGRGLSGRGTLYHELRQILQSDGVTSISNGQALRPNRQFNACSYHVGIRSVHQAPWDYGYYRKASSRAPVPVDSGDTDVENSSSGADGL